MCRLEQPSLECGPEHGFAGADVAHARDIGLDRVRGRVFAEVAERQAEVREWVLWPVRRIPRRPVPL